MDRITEDYDKFKAQRSFRTVSEDFMDWVKDQKGPWFTYMHVDDAHYRENFFTYDTSDKNIHEKEFENINKYLDNLDKKFKGAITYDLALLYCDTIVKNIVEYLKRIKQYDNTIILITADHGYSYFYYPIRDKNVFNCYKETYNVPFIILGKDIEYKKIENFCTTKDIAPTLLSLSGLNIPTEFIGKPLDKTNGDNYTKLLQRLQLCKRSP